MSKTLEESFNAAMTAAGQESSGELTAKMQEALMMLRRNGALIAGKGNEVKPGSLTTVAASTIRALAARGFLTLHIHPDGNMMGLLTTPPNTTP